MLGGWSLGSILLRLLPQSGSLLCESKVVVWVETLW